MGLDDDEGLCPWMVVGEGEISRHRAVVAAMEYEFDETMRPPAEARATFMIFSVTQR